jgi:ubiquinone/menaquinone biosynthesis C-methylase UbiE
MEQTEYEKMYDLEDTYWWFQGRKSIIFSILRKFKLLGNKKRRSVIDLGCGTGLILAELNEHATTLGVDFSTLALQFCRQRGIDNMVCADVTRLPFDDASFDLLFALDLIEHISDDTALMKEMHRICRPRGMVMLTVPAYKFLWSEHDEALHHHRRYSADEFRKLIAEAGFEPLKFSYCISFMYLPIVVFRVLQKLIKPKGSPQTHLIVLPKWINSLLIRILKIEARLIRHVNFPFGISLICLAQKKD